MLCTLRAAATSGARALWQLGTAARCLPASASGGLPQLIQALSVSASGEAALASHLLAAGPFALRRQAPQAPPALHLDGSRTADPGEPRYTAPYWVPAAARSQHRTPPVLFSDPWPSSEEPDLRRTHAALVLQELRAAGRPLSVGEVQDAVNARYQQQNQEQGPEAVRTASEQRQQPIFATSAYVKHLLEHLRRTRMLYGKKNPTSPLSPGHPDHPRLYMLLPYQAARRGESEQLARTDEAQRGRAVEKALRRLRNGKPPFPIHRRRAHHSVWQHELAQQTLREL